MSRGDIWPEGHEPGTGFQPANFGFSWRDFLRTLPFAAGLLIVFQLRDHLGVRAAIAFLVAQFGATLLLGGTRQILRPERLKKGATEHGARRVRIEGIVWVVIGTAVTTVAIGYIALIAEGW